MWGRPRRSHYCLGFLFTSFNRTRNRSKSSWYNSAPLYWPSVQSVQVLTKFRLFWNSKYGTQQRSSSSSTVWVLERQIMYWLHFHS